MRPLGNRGRVERKHMTQAEPMFTGSTYLHHFSIYNYTDLGHTQFYLDCGVKGEK